MAKFELDIAVLKSSAKQLSTSIADMMNVSANFSNANTGLTISGWKGSGAKSFNVKNSDCVGDFAKYITNLMSLYTLLDKTVLSQAKTAQQQMKSLVGIFGGSVGSSTKIAYNPTSKSAACSKVSGLNKTFSDDLSDLTEVSTILGELQYSSYSGSAVISLCSDIETIQTKLTKMVSSFDNYETTINQIDKAMAGWKPPRQLSAWSGFTMAFLAVTGLSPLEAQKLWNNPNKLAVALAVLLGVSYSCEYRGDPVNMATGNFIYTKDYLSGAGPLPLTFKVFYNSLNKETGALGTGWVHNFDVSAQKEKDQATLCFDDGHKEVFTLDSAGVWESVYGTTAALESKGDRLLYTTREKTSYLFDEAGKLESIRDANTNFIRCIYDEAGILIKAESNTGAYLTFSYKNGNLSEVADQTGRKVVIAYSAGQLTGITDECGATYTHRYNEQGLLFQVQDPEGITALTNTFDGEDRIASQSFADGGVNTFAYADQDDALVFTEQNGNEIAYIHDGKFRSTETRYFDGTEKTSYNDRNLPTSQTDKRGNTTRYSYDEAGNLTCVVNPLGEVASATFDERVNKPTEVTLAGQRIFSANYDASGNPIELLDGLKRLTSLAYNGFGLPEKVTLPDKSVITLTYDSRANITSITDFFGMTIYAYNALGQVISSTDPLGDITKYEYNGRGDIACTVNAAGDKRSYTYNKLGRVTKVTDFDGSVITWTYTPLGKVATITDQELATTKFVYDLMGNATSHIDALGNVTHFEYDLLCRLTKVTDATGTVVAQYEYDPCGNRTKIIDALGAETLLTYDALNRLTAVTEADGATTTATYNARGQVTQLIDATGHSWTRAYDGAGQLTSEIDAAGVATTYTYSELGRISTVTDASGRITTYEYLPGGLLAKEGASDGRYSTYQYDAAKQLISTTNQDGYSLCYIYDRLGRITKITSSADQTMTYTYDSVGNVTSTTDANGNIAHFTYTPTGRLSSVTDAVGTCTEYNYDLLGDVISVAQLADLERANKVNEQNAQQRITTYKRNALGQIETITDALGRDESYTYDPAGNLISKLDKEGFLTKYAYGVTGQPERIDYADGKSVELSYNALRQLIQVKDWLGITSIEVDAVGRATKVTNPDNQEVSYTYGKAGERTSITYPDGKTLKYSYDEALRLKNLTDGDLSVDYAYDQASRIIEKAFSNGTAATYSYNETGALSELVHTDASGILDRYVYGYDSMLNKTSIEKFRRGMHEAGGSYAYSYDAASRLTEVTRNGALQKTFAYDTFGNRISMVEGSARTDYTYNALNQLIRTEGPKQSQDFIYDVRGNLTQILEAGKAVRTYEYGALGRLAKATDATGRAASYTYNGLGQRVGQQITDDLNPTKHINYLLDLTRSYNNLLVLDDGVQSKSYLWDGKVIAQSSVAGACTYLHDELGSPLRFIGSEGAAIDSYDYDVFGADLSGNQGAMQPFGYTGYSFDGVAGTYFAQLRNFDPSAGRFTSQDPIKADSNWYSYCDSNPLVFVDPMGLAATPPGASLASVETDSTAAEVVKVALPSTAPDGGSTWKHGPTSGVAGNTAYAYVGGVGASGKHGIFSGNTSVYSGYTSAGYDGSVGLFQKKSETNTNGKTTVKTNLLPGLNLGANAEVDGTKASANGLVGSTNAGLAGHGDVQLLTANAGVDADVGFRENTKTGNQQFAAYVGADALASVVNGEGKIGLDIFGYEVDVGVSGHAVSAGFDAFAGYKDGTLDMRADAAALFGAGVDISIGRAQSAVDAAASASKHIPSISEGKKTDNNKTKS